MCPSVERRQLDYSGEEFGIHGIRMAEVEVDTTLTNQSIQKTIFRTFLKKLALPFLGAGVVAFTLTRSVSEAEEATFCNVLACAS